MRVRSSLTAGASRAAGMMAVAAVLGMGSAAQAAIITSSVADYEPRMTRPTGSTPGTGFAIDTNIDTPSDAAELRIGGQDRFKFTAAFFYELPALAPGETIANANLRFVQRAQSSTLTPSFNVDLRALGITQDIAVENDPDTTGQAPTVGTTLRSTDILYSESDTDLRPGIGTTLGRLELQDNFLVPADVIQAGGTAVPRESDAVADALLTTYLNALYAEGVPAGSFLIVTLNPDAAPGDTQTNRFGVAAANSATVADRPVLSFDIVAVPEPTTLGLFAAGGLALLARRRQPAR